MNLSWTQTALPGLANVGPRSFEVSFRFQPYHTVQKDFVQTVRAVEDFLGIHSMPDYASGNITATMQKAAEVGRYSNEVKSVLTDSVPVLFQMLLKYGGPETMYQFFRPGNEPLTTKYVYLPPMPQMSHSLAALWT